MIMENHDIVIAHPNGKDKNNRWYIQVVDY